MAQIVPDVTVVSEIVNIAVAFRSSVWPYKLNLSPCQWIFIKMDELVLYGGSGWGCTLWSWKVAKSSLRFRKNDHRACNKDHIFLLLFPHHLILHGYKIWMPSCLQFSRILTNGFHRFCFWRKIRSWLVDISIWGAGIKMMAIHLKLSACKFLLSPLRHFITSEETGRCHIDKVLIPVILTRLLMHRIDSDCV